MPIWRYILPSFTSRIFMGSREFRKQLLFGYLFTAVKYSHILEHLIRRHKVILLLLLTEACDSIGNRFYTINSDHSSNSSQGMFVVITSFGDLHLGWNFGFLALAVILAEGEDFQTSVPISALNIKDVKLFPQTKHACLKWISNVSIPKSSHWEIPGLLKFVSERRSVSLSFLSSSSMY